MKPTPRKVFVVAGGLVVISCMAVAFAAWTSNGSGSAIAKSGTATPLTTTVAAVTTGLLYPNGPAGDVKITINNPNPYPVRVTNINGTGPGTITAAGGTGTCTTHGVTFTNQTGTWDVGANGSQTFTLTGAAAMATTSQDGCQGATFTIPVSLVGVSN